MLAEELSPRVYYTQAQDVWHVLLGDIAAARHSISIEQYILADDATGQAFAQALCAKAKEGVLVRLILDAIGSHTLYNSQTLRHMEEAGVAIKFYNEIGLKKLFAPAKWLPRDHCKNVVIDNAIVYVGSACVQEDMRAWRELHIRLTHEGVIHAVRGDFDALWLRIKNPGRLLLSRTAPWPEGDQSTDVRYVSSGRLWRKANPLYRKLLWQIDHAHAHIRLATPYFMPPYRLRRALKRAVARGVKVTLLLSEKTDVRFADWVARFYYPRLLKGGIHIIHMTHTIMHAKYMVVDDEWASIGSTNLDYLSLLRNREANLVIEDKTMIGPVISLFDEDIAQGREAFIEEYPARNALSNIVETLRAAGKRLPGRGQ